MRCYQWFILVGIFSITTLYAADVGRYISKKDHFSIQPPSFFNKPKIHREKHEEGLLITMIDDIGTLFRVEQIPVDTSSESMPDFILLTDIIGHLTATIRSVVPDTKIIQQESLLLDNKKFAQLCLFDFPKGSVLTEKTTQEKFDSMRGILVFMENGKYIILSYQTDMTFMRSDIFPVNIQEVYKRYRTHLIEAANSFRVEKIAMNKMNK